MIKLFRIIIWLSIIVMAPFLMSGCGSSTSEDDVSAEQSTVGLSECFMCHADTTGSSTIIFGNSDAAKTNQEGWLNGPHGNDESIDGSYNEVDLSPDNTGFPYYGYSGLGTDPECTTECHDQLDDGNTFESFYSQTGISSIGRVNRPVIGCESCHGAGENHNGLASMPYPKPDQDRCGQCHNDSFPDSHILYHPEGDRIVEDYQASPHANSINDHTYDSDSTTDVTARCSKCHTDEGAKLYKDVSGGHDELDDVLLPDGLPPVENANRVQCRTCHNAHNPKKLLKPDVTDGSGNVTESAEYRTCTNCHQLDDGYHGENSGYSWGGGYPDFPVGVGNFEGDRIIYDTHIDNSTTTWIEGYVLDITSERVCRDCHNPHNADATINRQWASSAHGGFVLELKEQAFLNTSDDTATVDEILYGTTTDDGDVKDSDAPGWVHYDFKTLYGGACTRCHTSTGFRNLASDPINYDPANNLFAATGEQREMLYCWACHSSNAGDLRDTYTDAGGNTVPLLFSDVAPYSEPNTRISAVPDLKGSNICMSCHSGRESGQVVKDAASINDHFGNFDSHYLPAGGILFRTIGYEFATKGYEDTFFRHKQIGSDDAPDTGSNGPCVGCHMRTAESHLFEPVEKNATGQITAVTADEQTCSKCHTGQNAMTATLLENRRTGYENALEALEAELGAQGIYYYASYPYFYTTPTNPVYDRNDPCNPAVSDAYCSWSDKDTLGSAFNLALLHHEPGAYVHNRYYTKRLVFDSIDFVDGGLNGTIDLSSYPEAAEWFQNDGDTTNDTNVTRP